MDQDTDSHPSEGRLLAYLDGELAPEDRGGLDRHVRDCEPCGRRLEELRHRLVGLSDAVAELSPPPSDLSAGRVRRRASDDGEPSVAGRIGTEREGGSSASRWTTATRIAASIAVLLGAAAALPGSPVRAWIDRSVESVQALLDGGDAAPDAGAEEASPAAPEVTDRSGVAVGAADGSISIRISEVPSTTTLRVRLVDGGRAGVWNAGGQYRTAPGLIEVTAPASEALLVEVPRSVGRLSLEVNGSVAAVKRGEVLDVRVPDTRLEDGEFTFRPAGTP